MIFRELDENHDWQYGRGVQNYARQNQAIGLNIKTRLLSWINDCFFDMGAGIDWLNRLGSKGQRDLLEADLRRIILQSEDVTGLIDFQTTVIGRKFSATFDIQTRYSLSYRETLQMDF